MAEAFAKRDGLEASSAGTLPASGMNPMVVQVMKEKGIDLSSKVPKMLTVEMIRQADLVVTMGCSLEAACPQPILKSMQKKIVEWHLDDPKGRTLEDVRRIRDEVEEKVRSIHS
jgi:protein-tyrosine-phosphatase